MMHGSANKLIIPKDYSVKADTNYVSHTSRLRSREVKLDSIMLGLERSVIKKQTELEIAVYNNLCVEPIGNRYVLDICSYDKYIDFEKVGVSAYSRYYTTIVSFADSLDWILTNMFNDFNLKKDISQELSRAVLTQNKYLLDKFTFDDILSLSYGIEKFVNYLYANTDKTSLKDFNRDKHILPNFKNIDDKLVYMFNLYIISYSKRIISFIISNVYNKYKRMNYTDVLLVSEGISEIVIYSDININEDVIISEGASELNLHIKSYKRGEYLKDINSFTSNTTLLT